MRRQLLVVVSGLTVLLGLFLLYIGARIEFKLIEFDGCWIIIWGIVGIIVCCLGFVATLFGMLSFTRRCWPWQFKLV